MTKDTLSITELSCAIHERHPYSSERCETKFAIPKIIEALLRMAERADLPVSFANGSDVHISLAGTPYKAKKGAAQAAKTRNDLQGIHYEIVSIDGGWGIQDVTDGFGDWFEYSVDKENKKDDEGNISDEGFHTLGETMLVTGDDWSNFEKGRVFRDWIRDNAPPTEVQVKEFWPGSPKAKPGGLEREVQSKGGKQRKYNIALQQAIDRIRDNLSESDEKLSPPTLKRWFQEKGALLTRGSTNIATLIMEGDDDFNPVCFDPIIPDCDELYMDEHDSLVWKDRDGREQSLKRRSVEPYLRRSRRPADAPGEVAT